MSDPDSKPGASPGQSGTFLADRAIASDELSERAELLVAARARSIPEALEDLSPEAARKALHELAVHQIELEVQNEELRRAQDELEVSRARYFDLYDLAPVGYVTIGERGLVLEANLTAAVLLDVPRSELVKQPWTRFIFPGDQDAYLKHRKLLAVSNGPQGCELRLLKSNGEPVWVRLEARIAQGAGGIGVARTALTEIGDRKRAEATLQASQARHSSLFHDSRDALLIFGPPNFFVTSINAAALAMFGAQSGSDFVGRTLWSHSPERQADGVRSTRRASELTEVAMQHGFHSFVWQFRRPSGEKFQATVVLVRMLENGAQILQATVCDDTLAQKQRAHAGQTERLASMGMLAASLGHEINNPLAYVVSNLERLAGALPKLLGAAEKCQGLRDLVGDTAYLATLGQEGAEGLRPEALGVLAECARDALEGAQRITRISRVLSAFSRAELPELSLVDVHSAIESAIAIAFNEIRFKAKLFKHFQPVPLVWASEGKLSQLFLNLLINAAHAIEAGHAEHNSITIRTGADNEHVYVEVKDTGSGIAKENLAQIFEPFFSTKGIGQGTGLGLPICRTIVADLGGELRVDSELGAYSCFIVSLPILAEAPRKQLPAPIPGREVLLSPRGRVLVIDDEAPLRSVLKRLIVEHEVVTAGSGAEALAILAHDQAFDLILCDLMMPQISGMDVHRWLVDNHPTVAKRLVFITGGAFGAVAADYLNNSGSLKIDKPFDSGELSEFVSQRVRDAKSEQPADIGKPREA